MKNRMVITLLLGLSACGAYAGDAYDPLYPHETMNPWKPTKGELAIRKKRSMAADKQFDAIHEKLMATPYTDPQYEAAARKWRALNTKRANAYWNNVNACYFSQPTFHRIESFRDRFSKWIASWY